MVVFVLTVSDDNLTSLLRNGRLSLENNPPSSSTTIVKSPSSSSATLKSPNSSATTHVQLSPSPSSIKRKLSFDESLNSVKKLKSSTDVGDKLKSSSSAGVKSFNSSSTDVTTLSKGEKSINSSSLKCSPNKSPCHGKLSENGSASVLKSPSSDRKPSNADVKSSDGGSSNKSNHHHHRHHHSSSSSHHSNSHHHSNSDVSNGHRHRDKCPTELDYDLQRHRHHRHGDISDKLIYIERYRNGDATVVHAYNDEIQQLGSAERSRFIEKYFKIVFSEESTGVPRHVMGIVHGAAHHIPDILDYFKTHYPDMIIKKSVLGKSSDIETTTISEVSTLF